MFQAMLFVGSFIALVIGALVILVGIGAITGCAGGLFFIGIGGLIAMSAVVFLLPFLQPTPIYRGTISMVRQNGKWASPTF